MWGGGQLCTPSFLLFSGIGESRCVSGAVCTDSGPIVSPEGRDGFWL